MERGFEASLKDLKLEDGVGGVQKLKPFTLLSEVFADGAPKPKRLYIVVQRPATSESKCLIGHRNSDDSIPWFFHLVPLASRSN